MIGVLQPVLSLYSDITINTTTTTAPCFAFNHALGSCWYMVNYRQWSPRKSGCSCCRDFWNSYTIVMCKGSIFLTDTFFLSQTHAAIHCRHILYHCCTTILSILLLYCCTINTTTYYYCCTTVLVLPTRTPRHYFHSVIKRYKEFFTIISSMSKVLRSGRQQDDSIIVLQTVVLIVLVEPLWKLTWYNSMHRTFTALTSPDEISPFSTWQFVLHGHFCGRPQRRVVCVLANLTRVTLFLLLNLAGGEVCCFIRTVPGGVLIFQFSYYDISIIVPPPLPRQNNAYVVVMRMNTKETRALVRIWCHWNLWRLQVPARRIPPYQ